MLVLSFSTWPSVLNWAKASRIDPSNGCNFLSDCLVMMDSFFGFIIQNDSLAMIVIALKYEDSKINEAGYRYSTN